MKKLASFGFLLVLVLGMIGGLVIPRVDAQAAPKKVEWVDKGHLAVWTNANDTDIKNATIYSDNTVGGIYDDDNVFSAPNGCAEIKFDSGLNNPKLFVDAGVGGDCIETAMPDIGAVQNKFVTAYKLSEDTVMMVSGITCGVGFNGWSDGAGDIRVPGGALPLQVSGGTYYRKLPAGTVPIPGVPGDAFLRMGDGDKPNGDRLNYATGNQIRVDGCQVWTRFPVTTATPFTAAWTRNIVYKDGGAIVPVPNYAGAPPAGVNVPGAPGGGGGSTAELELQCSSTSALTWLLCPIVEGISFLVTKLDDEITKQMTVPTNLYFEGANGNALYAAWSSFRYIALGLLVVVGLVMIFAHALSFDFVDAYTIKRIMPQMVVAILLITFSWPLMRLAIEISNDVGLGARALLYAPFARAGLTPTINAGAGESLIAFGGIAVAGAVFGIMGLLSFALTALIAVVMAFGILAFRNVMLIGLGVSAPIAAIAGILPNTQKVADLWKKSAAGAILFFPLASLTIGAGRVLSALVAKVDQGFTGKAIAFGAYILPYFLFWTLLAMGGGGLALATRGLKARTDQATGMVGKWRKGQAAQNVSALGTGERFGKRTFVGRGLNNATREASTFAKSDSKWSYVRPTGRGAAYREAARQQQESINMSNYANTDQGKVAQHNDPLLRAQTYATEAIARQNMAHDWGMNAGDVETAIQAAKVNGGFSAQRQRYAARQLAVTGTGYDDNEQLLETVTRVAGRNRQVASELMGGINSDTERAGRLDNKSGYQNWMNAYDERVESGTPLAQERYDELYMHAVEGNDIVSVQRGKPRSVSNLTGALERTFHNTQRQAATATTDGERVAAERTAGRLAGIVESYGANTMYASPDVTRRVDEELLVPTAGRTQEVQIDPTTGQRRIVPVAPTGRAAVQRQALPTVAAVDAQGNPVLDPQGNPVPAANPEFRAAAHGGYTQQRPRTYNPNDPYNQQ